MTEPSQYFKGRTVQEQMDEVIGYVDTRAAEVATTAIASDVAQVHQDMLDADADASAAAASAAAAAGTLANAVKKTGEASQSIAGDIAVAGTLSGGVVTGTTVTVPAPVNNTDAATKKYVDDADALKLNIDDVNRYAVSLTGNQPSIGGIKTFNNIINLGSPDGNGGSLNLYTDGGYGRVLLRHRNDDATEAPAAVVSYPSVAWLDKNGVQLCNLFAQRQTDGSTALVAGTRNNDGTTKYTVLARGNP